MKFLCFLVAGGVGLALSGVPPLLAQEEIPGRIILELTPEGARALRSGDLDLPIPVGGEAYHPTWRPLFVSGTGPLARFALVTFDPAETGSRPSFGNAEWLETLRSSGRVVQGAADRIFAVSALPDDPYFRGDGGLPPQIHLYNPGGLSLQATRAWPFVPAGSEVVVAVLDTGVDWRHPDLGGVSPSDGVIWTNPAEKNGLPGVDDDANGFVDDVVGWDFVEIDSVDQIPNGASPAPGEDANTPDPDPSDYVGHGTQVAGLITAIHNNATGIAAGVPGVRVMPLRVGWLGTSGGGFVAMSFCAQALEYAALNGARVANCSWDSGNILGLGAALDLAIGGFDMVVVGSAGNNNTSSTGGAYLASREDCLGVAGILMGGQKANPSNYGSWVDIAAFYEGMSTTFFDRSPGGSEYRWVGSGGTSIAAPQVSAQAALLRAAAPQVAAAEIRLAIATTGVDLGGFDPLWADSLGGGLADYRRSVETLAGGWDAESAGSRPGSYGNLGENVFFLGASGVSLVDAATGDPAGGWMGGEPLGGSPAVGMLPLTAVWDGVSVPPTLIWGAGDSLRAVRAPGVGIPGWPVGLPPGAGQPVAAPTGGIGGDDIYVPFGSGVLVLSPAPGGGLDTTELALAIHSLAAGGPDSTVLFAGIGGAGDLHVWREGGQAVIVSLGSLTLGPVIGEFMGPGLAEIVVAGPDSLFPSTRQNIYFVSGNGFLSTTVGLNVPPLTALSLTGFSGLAELRVVVVDSSGGIHLIDRTGSVQSIAGAGPVAGEILSADLNGDYEADLIALGRDGSLRAWNSGLELLAGFPRQFPQGARETPLVVDSGGTRFVVVADSADGLWSLPLAASGLPAPWPGASGTPGRSGFLGHERATPVEEGTASLSWTWQRETGGELCWTAPGADAFLGLRVWSVQGHHSLWEGQGGESFCATLEPVTGGDLLTLEGLGRESGWRTVGSITLPGRPVLFLGPPAPNPFESRTRLEWAGVRGRGRLEVFDVQGRRVWHRALAKESGIVFWDGTDIRGVSLPPGLYFFRIQDFKNAVVRRVLKIQ